MKKILRNSDLSPATIEEYKNILIKFDKDIRYNMSPYDGSFSEILRESNIRRVHEIKEIHDKIFSATSFIYEEEAQEYINAYDHHLKTLVYSTGMFLKEWDLIVPEFENNNLRIRNFAGARPYDFPTFLLPEPPSEYYENVGKPCIKNYFDDKLVPLAPFIIWEECPQCREYEMFYLKEYDSKKEIANYISFTSQHKKEKPGVSLKLS